MQRFSRCDETLSHRFQAIFQSRFVGPARKHSGVIRGTGVGFLAFVLLNRNARSKKMPLLFYFPLIVWMGMLEAMQDEMRVPTTAKPRR
jgi:hypothetical protein